MIPNTRLNTVRHGRINPGERCVRMTRAAYLQSGSSAKRFPHVRILFLCEMHWLPRLIQKDIGCAQLAISTVDAIAALDLARKQNTSFTNLIVDKFKLRDKVGRDYFGNQIAAIYRELQIAFFDLMDDLEPIVLEGKRYEVFNYFSPAGFFDELYRWLAASKPPG